MTALPLTAFATREALLQAAAERIASALRDAIDMRGEACAALSGGSTPEPAYRLLSAMRLDWPKITFALVDERFVPFDHPASNEGMIQRALASAFDAGADFKPLYFAAETVLQAADCAEALYAPLQIDIALMGMGDDGHTASWFPGAEMLSATLDPSAPHSVAAIHAPQAAGAADRLTLTRAAYNRASRALLLIAGDSKRAVLEAAAEKPILEAPVAALLAPGAPPLEILWAP